MSWLARSFADSLRLDSDDDPSNDVVPTSSSAHPPPPFPSPPILDTQSEEAQSRGVKDDLSELGHTLTRQFWGVASFLAPPATDPDSPNRSYRSDSSEEEENPETSEAKSQIRTDFAEIGGRFRSGVSEISRMASNLIGEEEGEQVERSEEDEGEGFLERDEEVEECFNGEFDDGDGIATVGITHEVLTFARNIAMHPETWLDFPLDEEEDPDDFDMSEAQREHAFAIEQFSPRLAALRFELCPCHMSLGYFWKVYFVLLHSRLNKADADILSTPQVMEARAQWMQELHEQTKPDPDYSATTISNCRDYESNSLEEEEDDYHPPENIPFWSFSSEPSTDHDTEKHPFVNSETPLIDKSVIEEEHVSKTPVPGFEEDEDDDQWLEDEDIDLQGAITVGNEEDVSFSDLEDDNDIPFSKPKPNTFSKDFEASLKKS